MEEIKLFLIEYWPTIVEYALMFVAYFLVFMFRKSTTGTKQNLNLAFGEFKTKFADTEKSMQEKLEESQAAYLAAVSKIERLYARIETLEETVTILLSDDEVEVINDVQHED